MTPIDLSVILGQIALSLALLFSFVRLWIGPTREDRVLALEVLALVVMGLIAIDCIASNSLVNFDLILVWAGASFFSTVVLALFMVSDNAR